MSPDAVSGLDRLSIHPYGVQLVAEESVRAPRARLPNMLRGTFEIAFRRLVCHDLDLDCQACPLIESCPYPAVFHPTPPPDSDRLSRAQDLPRPFVFEPPTEGPDELARGDALAVGLTLFGAANRHLPYFVVALRALAERGLGVTRGRLRLTRLTGKSKAGPVVVFEEPEPVVRPTREGLRLRHLAMQGDAAVRRLRVRFVTPTTLKRNGRLVEKPSFADLACRIRDRLSSLAAFFGDGPIEMDFAGVGRAAEEIRTVACTTAWERRTRRSSRTGALHEISGFAGEAVYEGDLGPWMPLLRMGEAIHVGKYAVWGNGGMVVEGL
jgi:CRISPR-associated endoribonuclease Cas6